MTPAIVAGATVALLAATVGSAMAYPLSHFGPYTGTSGKTKGNITGTTARSGSRVT